uniref:Dual specificity phosphatase catalytic domain-containing protein n=1 Tax=Monopterus albus TaxID=43700 RepID=A0A3Q3KR33_MONAL
MTATGRGWVEALAAVRARRPCAGPNLGFLRQMEEFENTELSEVSNFSPVKSCKVIILMIFIISNIGLSDSQVMKNTCTGHGAEYKCACRRQHSVTSSLLPCSLTRSSYLFLLETM